MGLESIPRAELRLQRRLNRDGQTLNTLRDLISGCIG
jgi:hypothetical protein